MSNVRAAVEAAARKYGVDPDHLEAIVITESAGRTFAEVNGRAEPLIRFEGHYFDRLIDPSRRAEARKVGLAAPNWGVVKNPRSQQERWDRLLRPAMRLDRDAALCSCSWGVGQVMGSHWEKLGFSSVGELVETARSGAAGQVELMMRYIVRFGLLDEVRRGDWPAFFRGYNGPAWKKNGYDAAFARALKQVGGSSARPSSSGMIRMGSRGARVREIQALLARAGYAVKVDGDFGPSTKAAVMAFQQATDLDVDGVVGPVTLRALMKFKAAPEEAVGETPVLQDKDVIAPAGGGTVGGVTVEGVKQQVDGVLQQSGHAMPDWLFWGLTGLSAALVIGGLGWAAWRWWKKRDTDDGEGAFEWRGD